MITIPLRGDFTTEDPRLDRLPSKTDAHIRKYPLRTIDIDSLVDPMPMAIGVNWYATGDNPEQDAQGHWWIGRGPAGRLRGGHSVCLKGRHMRDYLAWQAYYNQLREGRCVQFAVSRMMTQLNRKRYEIRADDPEGRWLYWEGQRGDEWAGGSYPGAFPVYEGTSVNAVLRVVKDRGIIPIGVNLPVIAEGIVEFRWATDWNDVKAALGYSDVGYVDMMNSWGMDYPHLTRIPDAFGARLLAEDGEFGIVVDRR